MTPSDLIAQMFDLLPGGVRSGAVDLGLSRITLRSWLLGRRAPHARKFISSLDAAGLCLTVGGAELRSMSEVAGAMRAAITSLGTTFTAAAAAVEAPGLRFAMLKNETQGMSLKHLCDLFNHLGMEASVTRRAQRDGAA